MESEGTTSKDADIAVNTRFGPLEEKDAEDTANKRK